MQAITYDSEVLVLSRREAECLAFEFSKNVVRAQKRSKRFHKVSHRRSVSDLLPSPLPILKYSSTSSVYKIRLTEHTPFFTEKFVCFRGQHLKESYLHFTIVFFHTSGLTVVRSVLPVTCLKYLEELYTIILLDNSSGLLTTTTTQARFLFKSLLL